MARNEIGSRFNTYSIQNRYPSHFVVRFNDADRAEYLGLEGVWYEDIKNINVRHFLDSDRARAEAANHIGAFCR